MHQPRVRYTPLVDRPKLAGPNGARLIVHMIVNVEEWSLERPMPRTALPPPGGVNALPDVPNWSWAEYGMRVGFWRVLETLERHRIKATLSINANVCNVYPQVARAAVDAGWEMMGHNVVQRAMNVEEDERKAIRATLDLLEEKTGQRPRGWLGPGLCETWETPDHLAAEGIEYVCDWGPADEQPFVVETSSRPLVAVPYPIEMNDIVLYAIERRPSEELFERGRRQFDQLYAESETNTRVMAIALHPYLTGVPHRIGALEALLAHIEKHPGVVALRGGEILDWYRSAAPTLAGAR